MDDEAIESAREALQFAKGNYQKTNKIIASITAYGYDIFFDEDMLRDDDLCASFVLKGSQVAEEITNELTI
jgi:hypothetical protein